MTLHIPENYEPIDDFEGLSPHQMEQLLYNVDYSIGSIVLKNDKSYLEVPFIRQVKYLLSHYDESKGIILTPSGYLPLKLVKDLYTQKYLVDKDIDIGITKLSSESKSLTIQLTHIICEITQLIRKVNNCEFLTEMYYKIENSPELLQHVFTKFVSEFNWGYFDGYDNEEIGRLGFNFTLYLLKKFGKEKRPPLFYAEKYFKAFPMLIDDDEDLENNYPCYSVRTFERFLLFFGLIEIEYENGWVPNTIITTPLFDKLVSFNLL